jgi:hypothetical protein
MPVTLHYDSTATATVEQVMDHFSAIDIADRAAFLAGAPLLHALGNNRRFLVERIAAELKDAESLQQQNQYSSQVFFLGKGRNYFMRANFWPAANDPIVHTSGPRAFFYGIPHDHNFDFLTVGYYGPGYLSDFYEYDFERVTGYVGEKLELRFMGREALPEGRVMLYRSSIDIHEQLPPASFSISLNVVSDLADVIPTVNQYYIDTARSTVAGLANRTSLPLLCEVAAHIGDDECRDILTHLSAQHPHARGRYSAFEALAQLCGAEEERLWLRAAADPHRFVHVQARQRLDELNRVRRT